LKIFKKEKNGINLQFPTQNFFCEKIINYFSTIAESQEKIEFTVEQPIY